MTNLTNFDQLKFFYRSVVKARERLRNLYREGPAPLVRFNRNILPKLDREVYLYLVHRATDHLNLVLHISHNFLTFHPTEF